MASIKFTIAILLVIFACFSQVSAQNIKGFLAAKRCTPKSRQGQMCVLVVQPVCGYRPHVVCAANDPITCNYVTYSNACEACHDSSVSSYTKGACPKGN